MTIEQFIQKAIEGGWEDNSARLKIHPQKVVIEVMFLDPLAWQAVGRVEMENGNGEWAGIGTADIPQSHFSPGWLRNMHRMIDALEEGKSIEEFLATL